MNALHRLARSWHRLPAWLRVVLVFGAARVVTTLMMLWFAAHQQANPWTGPQPGYTAFASIWDGRWYQIVAAGGYPSELPRTEDGFVSENAWAFMPVYPAVVRLVMTVTFLPWDIAAVVVSVLCGFGAALVFHRLMREVLAPSTAMFAVVLFAVAPTSPILQVAYAESLYFLLLGVALLLVLRHRYLTALPVIAVMALTRPSGLAFALFLLLHLGHRQWCRARHPFPVGEAVRLCVAGLWAAVMGFAWPVIAWIVTGSMTAYTDTELAWRSSYIGHGELVPFSSWFEGADWWMLHWFGLPGGAWVLLPLLVVVALGLLSGPARRLGVDLRLWVVAYLVYLLAVFFPQSSTFRLLAPAFPILGAFAVPRSRVYRIAAVAVSLALQWCWLAVCWRVDGYDWTPP
ncbi:Mannosyltransferase (PIG-V) [Paramicrobacterium humi]|uniref:Mannosyltransferase (PIG-V) n=1 Tax=Paramicrobacterium humi TaxID=640635 RepID=A0A1H4T6H2_9MICO|nr:mannosyltransferase family protein [Microbacterium humi]SEC52065.1 Mannosyltransferase (PIG-V) [Microbacterium humi]